LLHSEKSTLVKNALHQIIPCFIGDIQTKATQKAVHKVETIYFINGFRIIILLGLVTHADALSLEIRSLYIEAPLFLIVEPGSPLDLRFVEFA
jgi:hypothetical protein